MVWFFWIIVFTFWSEINWIVWFLGIVVFTFWSERKLDGLIFLDYSFHFLKVGNLREGEALIVAKAVSPSRALPLLATPLWCVVECVSVSAQSCILLYRQWQAEPIIDSAMYSAALAVAGWADYCFGTVFCCTDSSRLSRLLLRHCLLLLHCLSLLAEWESGLRSGPVLWIVVYRCYSGTGFANIFTSA